MQQFHTFPSNTHARTFTHTRQSSSVFTKSRPHFIKLYFLNFFHSSLGDSTALTASLVHAGGRRRGKKEESQGRDGDENGGQTEEHEGNQNEASPSVSQ